MGNDKLIQHCIPRLYHREEFTPFLQAIDRAVINLEGDIEKISGLIDVDSCPDFALPYLAELMKCPLWGQSPLLWRKQIKNWPHVCRMKGTKKALRYFFDSLGIVAETIETYWRDSFGEYVVERPEGIPYLDRDSGLWYKAKTHYFGVLLSADEENIVNLPDADLRVVSKNILQWINLVKPFHAELLRIAWMVHLWQQWEIKQRAECVQTVEARHNYYNLGSAQQVRWNAKKTWGKQFYWSGLYHDGLYRLRQAQRLECTQFVDSLHKIIPNQYVQATGVCVSRLAYTPKLFAMGFGVVDARQPVIIKNEVKATGIVDCKFDGTSNPRKTNQYNKSFCWDGSHTWGGGGQRSGWVENLCTIITTKNGRKVGIERV